MQSTDGATYITVQSGLIKTICSHPPKGLSINYSADYVLPGFGRNNYV